MKWVVEGSGDMDFVVTSTQEQHTVRDLPHN
jgi:hypothetical protein